jgi:signal transduction histidine kinase
MLEAIADGVVDDPSEYLQRSQRVIAQLARLSDDLVELARLDSAAVPLELAPGSIVEVVQSAVEGAAYAAEAKGIRLNMRRLLEAPVSGAVGGEEPAAGGASGALDGGQPAGAGVSGAVDGERPAVAGAGGMVEGERPAAAPGQVWMAEDSIARVLANLLDNAIRHTPPGGEVLVELTDFDGWVQVSVQDNGEGIPADQLPYVFDRFYRGEQSRSDGGVGLGLAIAKQLVEAHGGRIWAESAPQRGTRVRFTLASGRNRAPAPARGSARAAGELQAPGSDFIPR